MRIFECTHYRQFIKAFIDSRPQGSRGMMAKMATHLGVHSTLMSLILSGKRELTLEQACDLIEFLELTEEEGDFFLLLVELERAGSFKLKKRISKQIESLKEAQSSVSSQLQEKKILSETDQAKFYSHWIYSGIRLYCSIGANGKTTEEIAEYFKLPRVKVAEILQFLVSCGLVKTSKGRYQIGEQRTYVGPNSPFLLKHHANWRLKSLQKIGDISSQEMMVSSPFSISRKDFGKIKEMLLDFIAKSSKVIQDTEPEDMACFNLDLFWVGACHNGMTQKGETQS